MRIRHVLTTSAVCGALLVAGCGGDDEPSPASGGGSSSGSQAAAPPSADTVKIDIRNIEFAPREQRVKVGQTVEWTNQDSVPHNVIDDGDAFKSDTLNQGDRFTFVAEEAGEFNYVCTIHSGQVGKLIVEG